MLIYIDLPYTPLFEYNNNYTCFVNFVLTFRLWPVFYQYNSVKWHLCIYIFAHLYDYFFWDFYMWNYSIIYKLLIFISISKLLLHFNLCAISIWYKWDLSLSFYYLYTLLLLLFTYFFVSVFSCLSLEHSLGFHFELSLVFLSISLCITFFSSGCSRD